MIKAPTYKRLLAGLIDLVIWYAVFVCYDIYLKSNFVWLVLIFSLFILSILMPGYLVISNCTNNGMTIGKRALGIRVADKYSYRSITFWQAIKRDWLLVIIGLLFLFQQSYTVLVNFDYYNAIATKDWSKIDGYLTPSKTTIIISYATLWGPPAWFLLEAISTILNPNRESIQDRASSSVTINHIQ